MTIARAAVLLGMLALAFNGCSSYKQVNDSSDGDNGKTKNRPSSLSR
jgi:hypothetical protein